MNSVNKVYKTGLLLALALLQLACGGDEYQGFDNSVTLSTPNRYLTFFNRQGELATGQYRLVVATAVANQSGSFSVQLSRNDGSSTELLTGNWTNSSGPSATPESTCTGSPSNVCFTIDMQDAKGVTIELTTTLDAILYLVDDSDTPQLVGEADENGVVLSGISETLVYAESNTNATDYANAYYAAVDPLNTRDTLQKFISLHGFDTPGADQHVIFRDSKDLGYGRDMYMRSYANTECGGQVIAFYVRNFSVELVDGFAYGPVNLEAAIAEDLQHHVGSNAIEFSRGRSVLNCSPEPMTRFFTYQPDQTGSGAVQARLTRVDLDGRGKKAMPQPCISCHGGKLRPLDRFGRLVAKHANDPIAQIGDTKARLQAFEVDSFEFSDQAGHTQADYEEGLRLLNAAVYCSYPGSSGHAACASFGGGVAAATDDGEWSGDYARELLLGWYNNSLETANTVYDNSFVPPGWTPGGSIPTGADTLFLEVVGPNCIVCHSKRGTELGSDSNAGMEGKDLDFSSWDKFITHADEIVQLVYDEGRMPLGLLNYTNFWEDPDKAALLGSFLAPTVSNFNADYLDADGNIIPPGRIVARAGPDRVTQPNAAISLNAQASLFADGYQWSLQSSPIGSSVTLSNPGNGRTDFSADTDGSYVIRLTASSSQTGSSATDDLTVVVDNTLAVAPRNLTFYSDVEPFMNGNCTYCHTSFGGGGIAGVPVWWEVDASQPQPIPTSSSDNPSLGFYEQVKARVNLEFIEDSLLLKKPSGRHHYGGTIFNTALPIGNAGRANYDRFVNWIAEGAVCGGTASECPQ